MEGFARVEGLSSGLAAMPISLSFPTGYLASSIRSSGGHANQPIRNNGLISMAAMSFLFLFSLHLRI